MAPAAVLSALLLFASAATAETQAPQTLYAEHLFQTGEYGAARRAYKRLLFYHPNTESGDLAAYRIAQSYYYENDPARAAQLLREFPARYPMSPHRLQARLTLGQLHYDAGAYSLARTTLFDLLNVSDDAEITAAAHYLRGWCYLHTGDWNRAITELRRVETAPYTEIAHRLADTLLVQTPLPQRSPKTAAWLSTLLPGSGQLYAGRTGEGLLAAALSGAFIYLAVDAVRERRYLDSAGLIGIGWQFYWGNRLSAQRFATEYNTRREQELIETLKKEAASSR